MDQADLNMQEVSTANYEDSQLVNFWRMSRWSLEADTRFVKNHVDLLL